MLPRKLFLDFEDGEIMFLRNVDPFQQNTWRYILENNILLSNRLFNKITKRKESKAISVTGRGGLWGCEMLRISHCLDNRLTDGVKVVSPTHRPHFTPQKHYYFYVSGTHFC
jgi:hypothetical protein